MRTKHPLVWAWVTIAVLVIITRCAPADDAAADDAAGTAPSAVPHEVTVIPHDYTGDAAAAAGIVMFRQLGVS